MAFDLTQFAALQVGERSEDYLPRDRKIYPSWCYPSFRYSCIDTANIGGACWTANVTTLHFSSTENRDLSITGEHKFMTVYLRHTSALLSCCVLHRPKVDRGFPSSYFQVLCIPKLLSRGCYVNIFSRTIRAKGKRCGKERFLPTI